MVFYKKKLTKKNQIRIESKSLEILHSFRIKILNFYNTDKIIIKVYQLDYHLIQSFNFERNETILGSIKTKKKGKHLSNERAFLLML